MEVEGKSGWWKGRVVGGNTVVGVDGGCGGEMRDA